MKKLSRYALVCACLAFHVAQAQPGQEGLPSTWTLRTGIAEVPVFSTNGAPEAPDQDAGPGMMSFGTQLFLQVDVVAEGLYETLGDGSTRVRALVSSPDAVVLSLQFDLWELAKGATVHVYDTAHHRLLGPFDHADRSPVGDMATALLPGNAVVIEYLIPAGAPPGQLRVASLTHGHTDPFDPEGGMRSFTSGQSAACNVNVTCPEGLGFEQQKRGVALFIRPDGNGCTGTLINNTAVPGRPLFYLANHCFQDNTSQWIFYFNYEADQCAGTAGPTQQTLTGSTLLARDFYSDFALVELFTAPPAAYMPYYVGWDRSGAVPQTATVIHHPLFDVKKITIDNDPATDYFDSYGIPMWRNYWDVGLVQSVSSGSPLLDQNKRIVGQMSEGTQNCGNTATVHSGAAKFSAGWEGQNVSTRKRDHLDPANTTHVLNGYDPFASPEVRLRPRVFLEGSYESGSVSMNDALRLQGLLPLQEPYTALGYTHVGGGGGTTQPSVLAISGSQAIVDWVVVELRSTTMPGQILSSKSALLRRDGFVLAMDGVAPLSFPLPPGNYRVAIRHRNHLGIMSAGGVALSATSVNVDLSDGSIPLFGGGDAAKTLGGRWVMYAGDTNGDEVIRYTGNANDRDVLLEAIGGQVASATAAGYLSADVNMDGIVRYTGNANDRDILLQNIGGTLSTGMRNGTLP